MKNETLLFFQGTRRNEYIVHKIPFMGGIHGPMLKGKRPVRAIIIEYHRPVSLTDRNRWLYELIMALENPIAENVIVFEYWN